ncbi:hypothetical protein KTD26_32555, partial [Burkholderia multivorans]|nr:hypothetical protein [Burkholderia multivorans]
MEQLLRFEQPLRKTFLKVLFQETVDDVFVGRESVRPEIGAHELARGTQVIFHEGKRNLRRGNVPQTVEGWDGGCGIDYATLRSWSMLDFEGERFRAAASTQ